MQINNNMVVSLTYELRENDNNGEILEKVNTKHPMNILVGHHQLLGGFEQQIIGKIQGETFDFGLKQDDAYGKPVAENFVNLPISAFEVEGKVDEKMLQIGTFIPMVDEHGNKLQGRVSDIKDQNVLMDFNHPLAGKDLHFSGTIESVRMATEEELSHGHAHHECSCGGGCDC